MTQWKTKPMTQWKAPEPDPIWLRTIDLSASGLAWLRLEKKSSELAKELASALEGLFILPGHDDIEKARQELIGDLQIVSRLEGHNREALIADEVRLLLKGVEEWGEHIVTFDGGDRFNCRVIVLE